MSMSNTNRNRRYKGYDLVNVGLSWYIGPHDPLGHRGEVSHGTHIGTSFAAAKREIDARLSDTMVSGSSAGARTAPIEPGTFLLFATVDLRANARDFVNASEHEDDVRDRDLKIAALNYVRALVESYAEKRGFNTPLHRNIAQTGALLAALSVEIEP